MIDTTTCLEFHAGNDQEANADTVFTLLHRDEANAFVQGLGGTVTSKREGNGWFRVPASQGGGWIQFPAVQVFVVAGARRFLVQVPVREVSPMITARKGWR